MDRTRRLRKGAEFDRVYAEGTVIGGPFFVVRVLPNETGHARWGFAVGKKLSRSAVVRNRVKRRMKEAARTAGIDPGVDIILTARPPALGASWVKLSAEMRRALEKAVARVAL